MSNFSKVQKGLDADVQKRAATEHRERCSRVLAQLPKEFHQMAYVLLAHADEQGMTDEAIIRACHIGGASLRKGGMPSAADPTQDQPQSNLSQQDLYRAGAAAAQELLGITPSTPVLMEQQAQPMGFKIDRDAYALGEASAKQIMALIGRKIGE